MKVCILQPNYIPWKGYFDLILKSDIFVFLDDVQYTKRDWRNRNLIKTPNGTSWITIPIDLSEGSKVPLNMVKTKNDLWINNHLEQFKRNYKKSKFFNEIFDLLNNCYREINSNYLISINSSLIFKICDYLDINTKFLNSSSLNIKSVEKSKRILSICKSLNTTEYITGIKSKNYIEEDSFKKENIKIYYEEYKNQKPYPQLWGGFDGKVSIVDLLFNCGVESKYYLNEVKY